ncbi:IclR family transcriptional regulator [Niallia endozanthoxylica]|uniref:Glycerol operon regulatory protein n=1 Tax=Niallia endozanthoxylica TaxID=2036016 RepID=A0A5J5H8P7_9BACI|nr:IclR family transcriptional regulator [Niallia endozanthoxylica]KAA9015972.1 IclR family transcriptional regulator [Niallia endozanthoxylica]
MATGEKNRYNANALERGLEILTLFNEKEKTLSLAEIASKLGVSRTMPYRLLYTLQSLGYLHQNEQTKRYELTPKVLELGFSYLSTVKLPEISQPYLDSIRDELDEFGVSCHLSILDGRDVVYIASASARGIAAINVNIGLRLPAHATANGKLLLAYQKKEKLNQIYYQSELDPLTERTYTSLADLEQELQVIHQNGYAISKGELYKGIQSIAAPIFDRSGEIFASINVVTTNTTFNDHAIETIVLPKLLDTAKKLTSFMGYC